MIIHLMDTLKMGYVINNTLDLSSRVMSLDAAKDILRHTASVSPKKVLRMSDSILTELENDTEGTALLSQTRGKGWVIQSSEYYDIQFRVTDGSATASFKINATSYNDPDNVTVNADSNGWCRYNIPENVTLTSLVGAFNEKTNIDQIVLGGAIDTRSLTDMNRMCRYADNVKYLYVECDTSNVTNFERMLQQRVAGDKLRDISLDVISNGANTSNMFIGATMLTSMNVNRISETLNLAESPLNLDSAKVILRALQTVTSETISFSDTTWGYILGDDDAIELLESAYNRGWSSNEPDIQIIADSGYNGKVNYNGSEQTLTQSAVNSNLWIKSNAGSITSLDCFSGMSSTDSSTYYNSTAVKIQKVRFGKNINTSSCTTIRRMFRGASTSNIQFRKGDFRHLNTSNVTNMNAVFGEIETNGEIIDLIGLENWNTSNVTNFGYMFAGQTCTGTLDLHTWKVKSGATTTTMFPYLSYMADRGCNPIFYYTPGYWSVDPMGGTVNTVNTVRPIVYPYHDINVAAASGFNGQMYKDTALVNMTKDNTLGIWYYDFSSSYTFSTNSIRSLFRINVNSTVTDNLYSVSFGKDAFSRATDAILDTFGMFMGCRALRSFDVEALSDKMTTGGYQMWNMGIASSSSLTTMHLPEFTQNYGYSATFQHCNSIRYAKFPTIKNASGYFASVFSGCTNLVRITNMPGILNGANTSNAFSGCSALTTIDACGPISETIDFSAAPLNLNSAKVILRQLQTVTSETLTFSSTTKGYINADSEALSLVTAARNKGWTISLS